MCRLPDYSYLPLAGIFIFSLAPVEGLSRLVWLSGCNFVSSSSENTTGTFLSSECQSLSLDGEELEVIAIKIGGSSLTDKGNRETINPESLEWFSKTVWDSIYKGYTYNSLDHSNQQSQEKNCKPDRRRRAYVIVHGAGSFGHHTAKEYDLKGKFEAPPANEELMTEQKRDEHTVWSRRRSMHGLSQTRQSVQTLNRLVVGNLIRHGVNAVAISPCFGIPNMQAHGGGGEARSSLTVILRETLSAGLVPVLHGDACLYGRDGAGILSGDVLVEAIGQMPWVSHAVFLTDVDGVYSHDPRGDPEATLLSTIEIDRNSLEIIAPIVKASGSSHGHDVTGGFKTKLGSAINIAASGRNVTIARCGSASGADAVRGKSAIARATIVFSSPCDNPKLAKKP